MAGFTPTAWQPQPCMGPVRQAGLAAAGDTMVLEEPIGSQERWWLNCLDCSVTGDFDGERGGNLHADTAMAVRMA